MDSESLARRIEGYLLNLSSMQQQWAHWLQRADRFGQPVPIDGVTEFQQQGHALLEEMAEMIARRELLLTEARQSGMPAGSLSALVDWLPPGSREHLQPSLRQVRQRLEQLSRIHIAAWVTLRESADFCHDSLLLMMCGQTRADITIDQSPPETGGQLLDADL
jgi:hypothetical protein